MTSPFPMCWKCSRATMVDKVERTKTTVIKTLELTACSDNSRIKNYQDAEKWCPAIAEAKDRELSNES